MIEIKRNLRQIPYNQLGKAGYNRKISRARVNEIKNDFHADMVRDCIISFRDGKYWIIDGQHTSQALYELNRRDPETLIPCDIREGLTYAQEADLYYRLNTGTKPLSLIQKIRGLIDAENKNALAYQDTIESYGYLLGGKNANRLQAISFTWNLYKDKKGKEKLSRILAVTSECWFGNPQGVHTKILQGLDVFFRVHADEYTHETLIASMSKVTPQMLIEGADEYYHSHTNRKYKAPYCMYRVILKRYNDTTDNQLVAQKP